MVQINVFGDSIAYGCWDREGGWVERLRKWFDVKTFDSNFLDYSLIYNLSISGDKTTEVLKRFERETLERPNEDGPTILLFAIGVNDAQFNNIEKEFRTPKEQFKKNLKELIDKARKISNKIIFMGLTPVDDSLVDPIPAEPEKSYKLENVKEFDKILKEVCKKEMVDFIEVLGKLEKENLKEILEDGLHPSSTGHQKFFETVKAYFETS
ncbi:MAG: GDSL-type esterase/lipase family protein [Patescibacteria group bacterium]|nr:GDSL-type esterase/lipase family protein [Patescibacteria group bacterium]